MRHPFEEMQALRRQMNELFEQSVRNAYGEGESASRAWAPAVDVVENEREIVLHAELPGLKKEDIDVQISGETLTIRGERPRATGERSENFHRIERNYGAFGRAFEIETPIDAGGVQASYEEGVLTVRLPKQERVRSRHIPIQTK
jgi:HSP20 family protein